LVPCHHLGRVHPLPPRRHRHCRPAVGNRRPSAPTPMPLTGTAAPGAGPGGCPGAWSMGRAAGLEPEHGAGHSFLWPPPAAALGPRSPVTSPSPSCDGPLPSPRLHRHRCLASRRGPLSLRPRPDAGALATRPPLPASGGKPGDGTPTPPVSICPVQNFLLKLSPGKKTPRVMGPGTNILYMADWRGLTAGDLSISLPPGSSHGRPLLRAVVGV